MVGLERMISGLVFRVEDLAARTDEGLGRVDFEAQFLNRLASTAGPRGSIFHCRSVFFAAITHAIATLGGSFSAVQKPIFESKY